MKNIRLGRPSLPFLFASLFLAAAALASNAQDLDHASIAGRVADTSGAVVAGAAVVAKLVSTGASRTVRTSGDGTFRFVRLEPGEYALTASKEGFATAERTGLAPLAGEGLRIDLTLAPAAVAASQTIVAEDDAAAIDVTRTVVGATLTKREIEDLPSPSRNPFDLVLILGGVSEEALSTRELAEDKGVTNPTPPAEQGNFSLSGGASYSNNVTVDGLDNNDDRSAGIRFQPSLEMIDEIQVVANQFSAEYGRASGGRVNLRLRGGTNRLRGRVFGFFRDARLNANSWSNNSRGVARPPLTEYAPGFTLGGPVRIPGLFDGRDRTFFSVGWEYLDVADSTQISTYVPVAGNPRFALPAGNVPCPATACADASSNPAAELAPYRKTFATPNTAHSLTAKFDHAVSASNSLTVGLQLAIRRNRRTPGLNAVTRLDDALQSRNADSWALNATDNHVFGDRVVGQFRAQYSVSSPGYATANPLAPVVLIGYRNPETGGAQTLAAGNSTASGGTSETFPQTRRETRIQAQATVSVVHRGGTLKTGFDAHRVRSRATELADATGTFNFANMGAFASNTLSRFRLNFGTGTDVRNRYDGFFAADELQFRRGLTLNLGLRYERESAIRDRNNLGPRLGMAWSPADLFVIRFGAGVFYNRVLLRTVADSVQNAAGIIVFDTSTIGTSAADPRRVAVLGAIAGRFPSSFATAGDLRAVVRGACASVIAAPACAPDTGFVAGTGNAANPLRSVDADLRIPRSVQLNIGVERALGRRLTIDANLTSNRVSGLWRDRNLNAPVLPAGFADWTGFLLANPFVFTNSNGTVRTYRFFLGDAVSQAPSPVRGSSTSCPTSATTDCWVNLNSTSASTASPSTAVAGLSTNAVGSALGIALAAVAPFRPDPRFEEKSRIGALGASTYAGLVVSIRSGYVDYGGGFGGSVRVAYTLSRTFDDGLNNTANAQVNGDFRTEFTRSLQDRRHRLAFGGAFDTPWWLGRLRLSPLVRAGSAAPFSIGNGGVDRNLDDVANDRPDFFGNSRDIVWRRPSAAAGDEPDSRFALATIGGRGGTLPRNAGRGPSFYTFDIGATREFTFGERLTLRPVIEIDNVLNAAVFNFGAAFIDSTSPNFLVPQRTLRQRQLRLGMRVDF